MIGVFYKYIELAEIRLKDSKKSGQIGPKFEELMDRVEASEEEIRKGLKDFECLELEGMWFILDQDYEMKVLGYILR